VERRPTFILIGDDDTNQAELIRIAFERGKLPGFFKICSDGLQVIRFLEQADDGKVAAPDLFLLDLNMPLMNGFQVLSWIRAHQKHKTKPVFILSSSTEEQDKKRAHELGCNDYFEKPATLAGLQNVLSNLFTTVGTPI